MKRMKLTSLLSSKSEKQIELEKAMSNARENAKKGLSPGAGLATADEQSDAAYADLINTSMDQRGIDQLEQNELEALDKGGRMWEKGSKEKGSKTGTTLTKLEATYIDSKPNYQCKE